MYSYAVPLVQGAGSCLCVTHYITTSTIGLARHYEQIKAELVRRSPELPNPATFAFETDIALPRIETYLPIAKQLVLDHVRKAAA